MLGSLLSSEGLLKKVMPVYWGTTGEGIGCGSGMPGSMGGKDELESFCTVKVVSTSAFTETTFTATKTTTKILYTIFNICNLSVKGITTSFA